MQVAKARSVTWVRVCDGVCDKRCRTLVGCHVPNLPVPILGMPGLRQSAGAM